MNEERLINATRLRQQIERYVLDVARKNDPKDRAFIEIMGSVCRMLDETPTVEAARVVHGRWIYKPFEGDPSLWLYHCSECDTPSANKRNYCNYCGAKMDLEMVSETDSER